MSALKFHKQVFPTLSEVLSYLVEKRSSISNIILRVNSELTEKTLQNYSCPNCGEYTLELKDKYIVCKNCGFSIKRDALFRIDPAVIFIMYELYNSYFYPRFFLLNQKMFGVRQRELEELWDIFRRSIEEFSLDREDKINLLYAGRIFSIYRFVSHIHKYAKAKKMGKKTYILHRIHKVLEDPALRANYLESEWKIIIYRVWEEIGIKKLQRRYVRSLEHIPIASTSVGTKAIFPMHQSDLKHFACLGKALEITPFLPWLALAFMIKYMSLVLGEKVYPFFINSISSKIAKVFEHITGKSPILFNKIYIVADSFFEYAIKNSALKSSFARYRFAREFFQLVYTHYFGKKKIGGKIVAYSKNVKSDREYILRRAKDLFEKHAKVRDPNSPQSWDTLTATTFVAFAEAVNLLTEAPKEKREFLANYWILDFFHNKEEIIRIARHIAEKEGIVVYEDAEKYLKTKLIEKWFKHKGLYTKDKLKTFFAL